MFIVDAVNATIAEAIAVAPRGTKAKIAAALDVAPATVSKWAAGAVTPEQHRWPELERLLGMKAGTLLAAHRLGVTQQIVSAHGIPPAVAAAMAQLGDELQRLRSEVDALRDELHGSVRSSGPTPPGPATK